ETQTLDDRLYEPYGVREAGWISLSGSQPNRQQASPDFAGVAVGHLHAATVGPPAHREFRKWECLQRQEASLRDHRLQLDLGEVEGNHGLEMRVNDRHHIGAGLVDSPWM